MLFTHLAVSLLLGLAAFQFVPSMTVVVTAVLAGAGPDMDMFWEHRKTLHRPFQAIIAGSLFFLLYYISGYNIPLLVSVGCASISLHCLLDILSNGKTAKPREKTDDRAVYSHFTGSWIEPRRLVTDGSTGDFVLLSVSGLAAMLISPLAEIRVFAAFFVVSGLIYSVIMKRFRDSFLGDHDRFSEAVPQKIGFGPELQ